jgi:hypothetical protein
MPANITLGEFTGPGAEEVKNGLPFPNPSERDDNQELILSCRTDYNHSSHVGREKVVSSDQGGSRWPKELPGWEDVPEIVPDYATAEFPLTTVEATLTAVWTLTDPQSRAIISNGSNKVALRRSYGGFLESEGKTPPESPAQEELLSLLAKSLADRLLQSLGPAYTASSLASAKDGISRQAATLAAAGDWDGAAQLWYGILKENPNYSPALFNLGLYHERRGDLETAYSFYRLAFLDNQTWPYRLALTRTTDALEKLGRQPKASPPRPF